MNKLLRSLLCGGVLVGTTAISCAGWAQDPHGEMGPDPERMLSHMTRELDLGTEQQSQVENLLSSTREATSADRERMGELRGKMLAMRDSFNAQEARTIADEVGELTGDMVYRAAETWSRVYEVLDAEQRARLESMMEKRGERRNRWHHSEANPAD